MGNGSRLTLYCNLSANKVKVPAALRDTHETLFYESRQGGTAALTAGVLPAYTTVAGLSQIQEETGAGKE